ncbi:MAG: winged helix DNA-binding protein [Xanthobacteraceae bacterium]|jgi:predicted MarR family transcription regulator
MASPTHRNAAAGKSGEDASHSWHLAEDATGIAMTDLEYAILRVFEAFGRWQTECLAAVSGATITGPENILLHVIAMKGRAKTIRDIELLTNRNDTPNVQYGLRKLIKLGFVEKQGSGRVGVFYRCTPKGVAVCKTYADLRKKLLLKSVKALPKFEAESVRCSAHLEAIEKIYTIASREAATFFRR